MTTCVSLHVCVCVCVCVQNTLMLFLHCVGLLVCLFAGKTGQIVVASFSLSVHNVVKTSGIVCKTEFHTFLPSFLPSFPPSLPPPSSSSSTCFAATVSCFKVYHVEQVCEGRREWGGVGRGLPCHRDFAVITVDLPCCGGGAKVGDVADFFLATWSRTKSAGCKGGGNCVSDCQCCTIAALLNTCIDCGADSTIWFRPPSLLSVVWSRGIVDVVVFFFS